VSELSTNPASELGETGCLVGMGVETADDGFDSVRESEVSDVSVTVIGAVTCGITPPKKASSTLLKLSLRSILPSSSPVPHGGLWQPRLTIPLTASMKLVPVIPPSTKLRSSVR